MRFRIGNHTILIDRVVIFFAIITVLFIYTFFDGNDKQRHARGEMIATVGDLSCNHDSLQTMVNVINYIKGHDVDAFVFLGDADYGNSYLDCSRAFFNEVDNYTTLKMVRGNHENVSLWKWIVNEHQGGKGRLIWSFEISNNTNLIGFNSNVEWNNGSELHRKLTKALNSGHEHKIIFTHKHIVEKVCESGNPKTRAMCGFYEFWQPIFKQYGVDCVVSAHSHMMAMYDKDGICYQVYGMGGANPHQKLKSIPDSLIANSSDSGFATMEITDKDLIHVFHSNNGTQMTVRTQLK